MNLNPYIYAYIHIYTRYLRECVSLCQVYLSPVLHLVVRVEDTDWNIKGRADTVHPASGHTAFGKRSRQAYSNVSIKGTNGEPWYCEVFIRLYTHTCHLYT